MCSNPDILQITRIVTIVIMAIRIIVPIILIVVLSIRIFKGIYSSEENETSKIVKDAAKKIVIAIAIFLVPSFVSLIMKVISPNNEYRCFINTTSQDLVVAKNNKAEDLVETAEEKLDLDTYNIAISYLDEVEDETLRNKLNDRLIKAKEKLDILEQQKKEEEERKKQEESKYNYDRVNYSNFKWTYYEWKTGPISEYYAKSRPCAIWAPEDVNELNGVSLPLIVWFHGAGENTVRDYDKNTFLRSGLLTILSNWGSTGLKTVPAIVVAPRSYDSWEVTDNIETVRALIEYASLKYNIDKSKIVFMGHSNGGAGAIKVAWHFRDTNTVYKIVGMSTNLTRAHSDGGGQAYYSSIPIKGYGEYHSFADFFEWIGQPDNFTYYKDESHGNVPKRALTEDFNKNGVSDLIEWLFYQ